MFHGSMVALVTPMDIHGEIDWLAYQSVIEFHVQEKTDALVVCGTTGESATLSFSEKQALIQKAVDVIGKRIPVIAGTNAQSTRDAIELTQMAQSIGVDACLIMTPAYIKPTDEGLYVHYKKIAESTALPMILYNVPGRTACDMGVGVISRLAKISNIVGVKEASGIVQRTAELISACGDKLDVYSGEDAITLDLMGEGAKGVISVTANVAPSIMREMCAAYLMGNVSKARDLNDKLKSLHELLFSESNPIPVKWALSQMNLISPHSRLPLTPLSEHCQQPLYQALKQINLVS